jgi:hypothetical protein
MGLFTNPLGHAGYPPKVTGTPKTQPSAVRAATAAEVLAGVRDDCYIAPATKTSITTTAADFASPPATGFGNITPRPVATTQITMTEGANIIGGTVVGTKIGTSPQQKFGFFGSTPVARQAQPTIINNVAAGGVTGTIANYTNMNTYSVDAPAIRNDIYQLAHGLQGCIAALKTYGLLG